MDRRQWARAPLPAVGVGLARALLGAQGAERTTALSGHRCLLHLPTASAGAARRTSTMRFTPPNAVDLNAIEAHNEGPIRDDASVVLIEGRRPPSQELEV